MHSCHPLFKSAWHHQHWCNPLCWVWQPLCDLFVYMCYCFYSSLWCYLHCIVFSKFPGSLCKWHRGKHNRVLNASLKTTVISLMSHVRWQMRDDQWHQACVGLNRVTFLWLVKRRWTPNEYHCCLSLFRFTNRCCTSQAYSRCYTKRERLYWILAWIRCFR